MPDKIKIGIIGTGGISHAHMYGYNKLDNVQVYAACDADADRAKAFGEKYDIKHIFTDYNKMLELDELDGISVCIWNNGHAPATIAALKAGKHVLCEKPMAMNSLEASEMTKAANEAGKLLMVGFVKRFNMETCICKDFIEKGYLGNIYYAKAAYLRRCGNPGGWFADISRSGGGSLIDLGVHVIDQARYLMGRPKAISVSAVTNNSIGLRDNIKGYYRYKAADYTTDCNVEDMASALIRFDNGASLSVETSFSLNIKDDSGSLELFGSKAGARVEPRLEFYSEMEDYLVDIIPRYSKEENIFNSSFTKEVAHFIDCIAKGIKCVSPAEDGLELMKILDAAYASAKAGKEVEIL